MKISILTLFPDMFTPLFSSVIGRAVQNGTIEADIVNIRDFTLDKHLKCDDTPFGGGAGMVMTPQPLYDAIEKTDPDHKMLRIYLSPKGEKFTQGMAENLATHEGGIMLICGHYEGIDERIIELCVDREISIGDYILTGGELAAMVVFDAVARHIPGVLGSDKSAKDESFAGNLLEYPQYTRPQNFMGKEVPAVLYSGNHANIEKWRREQSLAITKARRPDLLKGKKDEK